MDRKTRTVMQNSIPKHASLILSVVLVGLLPITFVAARSFEPQGQGDSSSDPSAEFRLILSFSKSAYSNGEAIPFVVSLTNLTAETKPEPTALLGGGLQLLVTNSTGQQFGLRPGALNRSGSFIPGFYLKPHESTDFSGNLLKVFDLTNGPYDVTAIRLLSMPPSTNNWITSAVERISISDALPSQNAK